MPGQEGVAGVEGSHPSMCGQCFRLIENHPPRGPMEPRGTGLASLLYRCLGCLMVLISIRTTRPSLCVTKGGNVRLHGQGEYMARPAADPGSPGR